MPKERTFQSGYDFADKKLAEQKAMAKRYTPKFYVERGKGASVIFLSDKPVAVEEHNVPDGRTNNGKPRFRQITSPATFGERDPLRDSGVSRTSVVFYYTVLDGSEYTDKNGKVHKWEKKLIGFKSQVFEIIKRRRANILESTNNEKTLMGAMFKVHRGMGDKTPATGDDWEFVKHVTKAKMLELMTSHWKGDGQPDLSPLNYQELLAPPPDEELRAIAARLGAELSGGDDEDEMPVARPAKAATKAKKPLDDEDADDDDLTDEDDEEEDEEPAPKKSKLSKKAAPVMKKKTRKVAEDEDDEESLFAKDDEDDETEDFDA